MAESLLERHVVTFTPWERTSPEMRWIYFELRQPGGAQYPPDQKESALKSRLINAHLGTPDGFRFGRGVIEPLELRLICDETVSRYQGRVFVDGDGNIAYNNTSLTNGCIVKDSEGTIIGINAGDNKPVVLFRNDFGNEEGTASIDFGRSAYWMNPKIHDELKWMRQYSLEIKLARKAHGMPAND